MLYRSIYQSLSIFSFTALAACSTIKSEPVQNVEVQDQAIATKQESPSKKNRKDKAKRDSFIRSILKPKARNQSVKFPEDKDLTGLESEAITITLPERLNVGE